MQSSTKSAVAQLRRALRSSHEKNDELKQELREKETQSRELLHQVESLNDEKQRLAACLRQAKDELNHQQQLKQQTLTGGSMFNTLLSTADGTAKEIERLKQELEVLREDLERRVMDLTNLQRDKSSMEEKNKKEIDKLAKEAQKLKEEKENLSEILESKDSELHFVVREKQELEKQMKTKELIILEVNKKLESKTKECENLVNLRKKEIKELQSSFSQKVPFHDTKNDGLNKWKIVPLSIRKKQIKWEAKKNLLVQLSRLGDVVIKWRMRMGSNKDNTVQQCLAEFIQSLESLYASAENMVSCLSQVGPKRPEPVGHAFVKMKEKAEQFVQSHEQVQYVLGESTHPECIHNCIQELFNVCFPAEMVDGLSISRMVAIIEALSKLGELLRNTNNHEVADVVDGMAKTLNDCVSQIRHDEDRLAPLFTRTSRYIKLLSSTRMGPCIPYDKALALEEENMKSEEILVKLRSEHEKLKLQYQETRKKLTFSEKLLGNYDQSSELKILKNDHDKKSDGQTSDAAIFTTSDHKESYHIVPNLIEITSEDELKREEEITRNFIKQMCILRDRVHCADGKANNIHSKYQNVLDVVKRLREERTKHYKVMGEYKTKVDQLRLNGQQELETTRSSYDEQLKRLTEYSAFLKEKMKEKDNLVQRLRNKVAAMEHQ